jgi:hypothetical protein
MSNLNNIFKKKISKKLKNGNLYINSFLIALYDIFKTNIKFLSYK